MKKLIIMSICVSDVLLANTFKMDNEIIKTEISYQHLNRISVRNDRISSITGVDKAFYLEKNDQTGECYIRATEENGYNPIAISVTTISGKTQDLLLTPVDKDPQVIELESDAASDSENIKHDNIEYDDNYEKNIARAMRRLMTEMTEKNDQKMTRTLDRKFADKRLKIKQVLSYKIDNFIGYKYEIRTKDHETISINLEELSERGDIAIALTSNKASKCYPTYMYVLRGR